MIRLNKYIFFFKGAHNALDFYTQILEYENGKKLIE